MPKRGKVWQVDFGITQKVRPALVTLLLFFLTVQRLHGEEPLPSDIVAAQTVYNTDVDRLITPLREQYAWQLESAKGTLDKALAAAIDAEIKRVGAKPSDPIPPELSGLWMSDSEEWKGIACVITPTGRGVARGTMFGAVIYWRYFAAAGQLTATLVTPEIVELQNKPFMTLEIHLAPDQKTFTIANIKGGSLKGFDDIKDARFHYVGAKIPDEFTKWLK